jgi:superfamily II DNA or RNA helicase
MLELRPYQLNLIKQTGKLLTKHNRVIMCAPTGSGKTVMFSSIIARHLERDLFNRVLVLTHRTELFAQTIRAIIKAGTTVAELKAGTKTTREHSETRCVVAMVETLKRRKELPGEFSLVICDEAHRADFAPIIAKLPPSALVLGATATPVSASKKHPLNQTYQDIAVSVDIPALIEQGYLARPRTYKAQFDESQLITRLGEFTDESQIEALGTKMAFTNLVQLWQKHAGELKTLVFCVNKAHTIETCQAFRNAGVKSEYVLSGDKERERKFSDFKSGQIQVLVNCEIATTGTDIPEIECILVYRSTKSEPLWMQMVGRGARVIPGVKERFIILDFGGNVDRNGRWEEYRDWNYIFHNPKKYRPGVAPIKECKQCEAIIPASVSICPECGTIQPNREEEERKELIAELVEVAGRNLFGLKISELTVRELIECEKRNILKPSLVWRIVRTDGKLEQYWHARGHHKGWFYRQLSEPRGYTNYTLTHKFIQK